VILKRKMLTIVSQKEVEFYPYKTVAILYNGDQDVWRVVGIREKQMNTILFEGAEGTAKKFYQIILENDNQ
tara:strand:- start:623 stop:835 length:213 start_codon:yes stop_codon:yes gene_type:complete